MFTLQGSCGMASQWWKDPFPHNVHCYVQLAHFSHPSWSTWDETVCNIIQTTMLFITYLTPLYRSLMASRWWRSRYQNTCWTWPRRNARNSSVPTTHSLHTLSVSHLCCDASTYNVYYSSSYLLSLNSSVPSPHDLTYSVMLSRIVMILVCWYTVIIFSFKTMG